MIIRMKKNENRRMRSIRIMTLYRKKRRNCAAGEQNQNKTFHIFYAMTISLFRVPVFFDEKRRKSGSGESSFDHLQFFNSVMKSIVKRCLDFAHG